MQEELPGRLQQLSDLAVTADHLATLEEVPETAAARRTHLARLRDHAEQFGLQLAQTGEQLKGDVKEAERKKQELEEYKVSVENIQRWIEEMRIHGPMAVGEYPNGEVRSLYFRISFVLF